MLCLESMILCIASDGQNPLAPRRRNKIKTKPLAESLFSFRQGLCQCRYMLLIRRFFCMIVNPAAYFSSIPAPIPAAVFGFQEALVLVWILYLIIRGSCFEILPACSILQKITPIPARPLHFSRPSSHPISSLI